MVTPEVDVDMVSLMKYDQFDTRVVPEHGVTDERRQDRRRWNRGIGCSSPGVSVIINI
jgi:hypothetical protein